MERSLELVEREQRKVSVSVTSSSTTALASLATISNPAQTPQKVNKSALSPELKL